MSEFAGREFAKVLTTELVARVFGARLRDWTDRHAVYLVLDVAAVFAAGWHELPPLPSQGKGGVIRCGGATIGTSC
jgi:hypothetical protein